MILINSLNNTRDNYGITVVAMGSLPSEWKYIVQHMFCGVLWSTQCKHTKSHSQFRYMHDSSYLLLDCTMGINMHRLVLLQWLVVAAVWLCILKPSTELTHYSHLQLLVPLILASGISHIISWNVVLLICFVEDLLQWCAHMQSPIPNSGAKWTNSSYILVLEMENLNQTQLLAWANNISTVCMVGAAVVHI